MKVKISRLLYFLILPLISAVLLVLAFPIYDQGWLAWIALVPLLLSIQGRSLKEAFLLSYLCGVLFFAGAFIWTFEIPGYKLQHHAILTIYLGLYFGLFGLIFNFLCKRRGSTFAYIAAPFVWVCLEYARSNLSFLALPWPLLAHSQYQQPEIIQFASFTGAYGVSFLVFVVNSAIALVILALLFKLGYYKNTPHNRPSRRMVLGSLVATAVLITLAIFHGRLSLASPDSHDRLKVSVVQGNIDKRKKSDPRKYAKSIMGQYDKLTQKVSKDQAALIVWPEAATPGLVLKNMVFLGQLVTTVRRAKAYFVIGSSEFSKFTKEPFESRKTGNTALYFSPEGKVLGQYLKIRLLPFGEYLPYEEVIPWPKFIIPDASKNWEIAGEDFTIFSLGKARFGVIICWENAFPALFRGFVKDGANLMINITNEGWFGESAAPYQFLAMCVLRAVENRVSLIRAANTGISCFIDPYGRITGRVMNNNKDIFVEGYLTREVPLAQEKTFYTQHGEIFLGVVFVVGFLLIAYAVLKREQ